MPQHELAPPSNPQTEASLWGDVTDPQSHDPNKFRYRVHGMSIAGTRSMAEAYARVNHESYGLTDEDVAAQRTDLLAEPERLRERHTLSASLIDTRHRGTWNKAGIIVGVPESDVVITAPHDAGTVHGNREVLERHNQRLGLPKLSPDELLEQTGEGGRSEVAIVAGSAALLVSFSATREVRGRFGITRTRDVDPETARLMARHAKRLDLPFVRIPVSDDSNTRGALR
jgi:hypothetical protein